MWGPAYRMSGFFTAGAAVRGRTANRQGTGMGSLGVAGRLGWRLAASVRRRPPTNPTPNSDPGRFVCVYRSSNARRVRDVISELTAGGWAVRLWALDEIPSSLSTLTVGSGPGTRTELLNHLVEGHEGPTLISDDDVEFPDGARAFVRLAEQTGLDLVQPAVTWDSEFSFPITACRPWLLWRDTTFVEIGPVIFLRPRGHRVVFPMDESYGMGWGLEIAWHDAIMKGAVRAGIVDAAPVRHLGRVAQGYARPEELTALRHRLNASGLTSLRQLQATTGRHWRTTER